MITGYKAARNRPLTRGQKLSNTALAAVRAPVEHGFAHRMETARMAYRVPGEANPHPRVVARSEVGGLEWGQRPSLILGQRAEGWSPPKSDP